MAEASGDAMGGTESIDALEASQDAPRKRSRKKDAIKEADKEGTQVGGIAVERLRSFIERVERLEEEKAALSNDIKGLFGEIKASGYDVKAFRAVLKLRKQEPAEIEEQETLVDVYRRALGM